MTLAELRARFWWLGPGGSYITSLDGDCVVIKVIQCTWNRRTQKYEEAVAADFAKLGLSVKWQPVWSDRLRNELEKAREAETKAGQLFDESGFVEEQRQEERRRGTSR